MFEELFGYIRIYESEEETKEAYFLQRTNQHIELVQNAARRIVNTYPEFKELLTIVQNHDQSKLKEPERTPYINITWGHKLENEEDKFDPINNKGYKPPGQLGKEDEDEAILRHIQSNSHHPEYWAPGGDGYKDE